MSMDEMTQQNAALVEEAAASAQAMAEQSAKLSELMARFQMGNMPAASARPLGSPAAAGSARPPTAERRSRRGLGAVGAGAQEGSCCGR